MTNNLDQYFSSHHEPVKSCLQFLREYILGYDDHITEIWSYGMPFYCCNGKRFCYLWFHKKHRKPYLGIVDGNKINYLGLISENRSRMKIFLIDPEQNIPIKNIRIILKKAIDQL